MVICPYNVNNLVDYVFGGTKEKLAFSWHQSDCTDVGLKSPDNQRKPMFLKELAKLWRRVKEDLPWKEGNYGPSNTLLVDDTPYKAILNPPNTAIFPCSYTARNHGDNFLSGALRSYLEGIRDAESVQTYVESNPFGEPSITPASPLWSYVSEVVLKVKKVLNTVGNGVSQIMPVEAVSNECNKEDEPNSCREKWKHHPDSLHPVEEVTNEDYQNGKQKRWRNRNQKYQLANNYLQSCESDFPSEIVMPQANEMQSSDCMLQPLKGGEQVHGFDADQQVLGTADVGGQEMVDTPFDQTGWVCCHSSQSIGDQERPLKQKWPSQFGDGFSSWPSGLDDLSGVIQDRSIPCTDSENYNGNNEKLCANRGIMLSFEQEQGGALESTKPVGSMHDAFERTDKKDEENKAINYEINRPFDKQGIIEGSSMRVTDAGVDAELDRLQEGHQHVGAGIHHGEGNGSNEYISVVDDSLRLSEPYRMRAVSSCEDRRLERRDTSSVHASNNNYASQHHFHRHGHKHREAPEISNMWRNSRHDFNRGRFSYSQNWKGEERYVQGTRSKMTYPRHSYERGHHFANKKHMDRQNVDKGYRNKTNCPRYPYQRWGTKRPAQPARPSYDSTSWNRPAQPDWSSTHNNRSWDQSQQDWWGVSNMNTPINDSFRGMDSNGSTSQWGSTGWVEKYNDHGRGQRRDPLSCSWQQGADQGAACGRSSIFPERIEQGNVIVHNPDRELGAVQVESMGNDKSQWFDFAGKEAGASSQPHSGALRHSYQDSESRSEPFWNAGAFSQPYRGQYGGSRQVYHNASAYQPYHDSRDMYRQGLQSGGFHRNRQSQEIRNL